MAENSKIEWCDHTVNLWWGCSKVHTGCKTAMRKFFQIPGIKKISGVKKAAAKELNPHLMTWINTKNKRPLKINC